MADLISLNILLKRVMFYILIKKKNSFTSLFSSSLAADMGTTF